MAAEKVVSITKGMPDHLAPVFAQFPLEVSDASGVYLHTPSGRKVLDLYGGHAVAALGYGHPRWVEALSEQARSLCFQSNAVPLDVRRRAATRLAAFCGLGLDTIFFVNSGAEANENALKLAFKMTGGTQVIAVEGSFHGRTAAAGAITWGAQQKWFGFPRAPFDVTFIKPTDIDKLGTVINDQTAAVIVEPVQGVAGAVDMPKDFLAALRFRCSENGSILDLRRSAMRCRPHRLSVRREHVRRYARHHHHRQVARRRLPGVGAADGRSRRVLSQDGHARHDVRRRPDGLRRRRGRHRHHRVGEPARERAAALGADSPRVRRRPGRRRRKAPACCSACAPRGPRRTCRPSC